MIFSLLEKMHLEKNQLFEKLFDKIRRYLQREMNDVDKSIIKALGFGS